MSIILVSGLINLEVTLQVDGFPLEYNPVRYPFFGVNSSVSGVGYNVAKALKSLGDKVRLLALIGNDPAAALVRLALDADRLPSGYVLNTLEHTPHSVILYDSNGRRAINVDLKDIQDRVYPPEPYEQAARDCDVAVLCNVNFSRPFLAKARQAGKLIATDVHTISSLDDDYNRDFMAAAHVLFMSSERLPTAPEDWARQVMNRFGNEIVVIGLGAEGALLAVKRDHAVERIPARQLRPIINTIGAGDALFSAFVHVYARTHDPYEAIQKAVIFASYKIGTAGAAEGFLDQARLNQLYAENFGK